MTFRDPSAVILGLSPTALYAARELGKAGVQLLGVDHSTGCAAHSRYFGKGAIWQAEDHSDLERRLLDYAATRSPPPLLLPTNDVFIEFVLQRANTLGTRFRFFDAYRGIASELLDKARFHALCVRHGIETPGVWEIAERRDLDRCIDDIPYPCILKPVLIHRAKAFLRGKKVLLVESREALIRHMDTAPAESGAWLIQEIIPGAESEITLFAGYIDQSGEPRQAFTARKLRQYPSGFGSASLVMSEPCSETLEHSVRFLQAIGFKGVCGTEYKRDPRDGKLKIIEINPRPTLWFHASHASGKRVVEAAFRDLAGQPPLPDEPQRDDVLWRYGLKDLASKLFYMRRGKQFVFPAPDTSASRAATRYCWPVFDASDPTPALFEPLGYVGKFFARLR
jgi:D-aspartate ligase